MAVQIINETPLALAFVAGRVKRSGVHLTAIVKGTFALRHGVVAEVSEPPLLSGDLRWGDEPTASLRYASDFAPWKPRADVLVTGTCHQAASQAGSLAGGAAQGSARVGVRVGPVKKALVVHGDRHFVEQALGGQTITEPKPFRSMPLRFESAYGGPGFLENPLGKGWAQETASRSRSLPNLELAGRLIRGAGDRPPPAAMGPIDPQWMPRTAKLGTYGATWLAERWPDFPADFDWGYFNVAPDDQQAPYLRGDEAIQIEGMHPDLPRFESHLPGLRPRCFLRKLQKGDDLPEEVELHLDTVTIDMDAATVTVLWRGLSPVWSRDYAEVEKALLVTEALVDAPLAASHYHAPAMWQEQVHPTQEQLIADAEAEGAAHLAAEQPPPPKVDEDDERERALCDEMRADLEKASAPPEVQARVVGVTSSAVFAAILADAMPKPDLPEDVAFSGPLPAEEKTRQQRREEEAKREKESLDAMRAELKESGADPALLAAVAAVTTVPKFLEVVTAAMPRGDSPAEKKQHEHLVASIRGVAAAAETADLAEDADEQRARGARLTRDEVVAVLAIGGSLSGANLTELDLSGLRMAGVKLDGAKLDGARLIRCDLTSADLTGASLRLADATGATLLEALLEGADCEGTVLRRANMTRVSAAKASFASAVLEQAILEGADLVGCGMALARLDGANLEEALLDDAVLDGASLRGVAARKVKLRGASLARADLGEAKLEGAVLIGCAFEEASFAGAFLRDAHIDGAAGAAVSFVSADLGGARAKGAVLPRAKLGRASATGSTWQDADLTEADFEGALLQGAIFAGAQLEGASFHLARLQEADLSRAKLIRARITRANLFRARLGGADLTDADCRASNLFECELFEANATRTRFDKANVKRTLLDRSLT